MNLNLKSFILICISAFLFFISFAVWTLASPVGSAPDEDFHQNMIYCAAGKSSACQENGSRYGHCYSMRPTVSGACKNYSDLKSPIATAINTNTVLPLYYNTAQFFVSDNLGKSTINIRLMNASLAILLGLISLLLTAKPYRLQTFLALIICSVPAGFFFIGSISPTAWAILSVALIVGPVYSVIDFSNYNTSPKLFFNIRIINLLRFIFITSLIAMGVGSRYETMIWIPLLLVFTVMVNFNRIRLIPFSKSTWLAISVMSIFLLGASILMLFERSPMPFNDLIARVLTNLTSWWTFEKALSTLFGMMALTGIPGAELGTHDAPISPIASFFISVAVGGAVLGGLSKASQKHTFLFLLLIFILFLTTIILWSAKDWDYYQSRYFVPIFYFVIFFALIGRSTNEFFEDAKYWLFVLLSIALAYSLVLLSTVLRFIYGLEFQQTRFPLGKEAIDSNPARLLDAPIPDWWLTDIVWLTPFSIWVIGSVSFIGALLIGWFVIKRDLNQDAVIDKSISSDGYPL